MQIPTSKFKVAFQINLSFDCKFFAAIFKGNFGIGNSVDKSDGKKNQLFLIFNARVSSEPEARLYDRIYSFQKVAPLLNLEILNRFKI